MAQSAGGRGLVLASGSPRREALLRLIVPLERVVPPNVSEDELPGESPWQMSRRLALEKLRGAHRGSAPVLTADTVVDLDGTALGKPFDPATAERMLLRLSGRCHRVHTSVALGCADRVALLTVTSLVLLRSLSRSELEHYIASGAAYDKAGGYGIQDPVCVLFAMFGGRGRV